MMVVLGVLLLVVLGGTAYYWSVVSKREQVGGRLNTGDAAGPEDNAAKRLRKSTYFEMLFGSTFTEEDLPVFLRRPGLEAQRAGLRMGLIDMLLLMLFVGLLVGAVVRFRLPRYRRSSYLPLIYSIGGGLIGMMVPFFVVKVIANRRVSAIETQLADALDMILGALGSGIGLRQALEVARTNMRTPIKDVLTDILVRTDLGVPFHHAFRDEAQSLRSKYFDLVSLAVTANTQAGAALTPMLQGLVYRIREAVRFRRRVKSLTAEARMSSVFLFAMPWLMMGGIYLMNKDWWEGNILFLWTDKWGRYMIYAASSLYVVGILMILKMLKMEE